VVELERIAEWTPVSADGRVWSAINGRGRSLQRRRRAGAGVGSVLALAAVAFGIQTLPTHDDGTVVITTPTSTTSSSSTSPTTAPDLPPTTAVARRDGALWPHPMTFDAVTTPVGLSVEGNGALRAGSIVEVRRTVGTPADGELDICGAPDGNPRCSYLALTDDTGPDQAWTVTVPGWVTTTDGLRSCADIPCFLRSGDERVGWVRSDLLVVDPGPEPVPPVAIERIDPDGAIHLRVGPEVQRPLEVYRTPMTPEPTFVEGGTAELVEVGSDGGAVVPARRLVRDTTNGWADCALTPCALVVGGAVLPYRLPTTAPIEPAPSVVVGEPSDSGVVTATLRDPARLIIDPETTTKLLQCSIDDGEMGPDCTTTVENFLTPRWVAGVDGTLSIDHVLQPCWDPAGCYLVVQRGESAAPLARSVPVAVPDDGRTSLRIIAVDALSALPRQEPIDGRLRIGVWTADELRSWNLVPESALAAADELILAVVTPEVRYFWTAAEWWHPDVAYPMVVLDASTGALLHTGSVPPQSTMTQFGAGLVTLPAA
jgi:hypothetical protein